ncbi:unnamed protein product [Lampetra planeri]
MTRNFITRAVGEGGGLCRSAAQIRRRIAFGEFSPGPRVTREDIDGEISSPSYEVIRSQPARRDSATVTLTAEIAAELSGGVRRESRPVTATRTKLRC